ncbi:hypothetical protein [Sphingomonas limnosediminicola]|uniref:hypothetical protein n=1 Tax=Sphingomonas limnosediminicola TaxID=940133 RepID=UPI0031DEA109
MDHEIGMGTILEEAKTITIAAGLEQIVDIEGDRRVGPWPELDERRAIGAAVEVRIELVGAVESEALVVVEREAVRSFP